MSNMYTPVDLTPFLLSSTSSMHNWLIALPSRPVVRQRRYHGSMLHIHLRILHVQQSQTPDLACTGCIIARCRRFAFSVGVLEVLDFGLFFSMVEASGDNVLVYVRRVW